MGLFGVFCLVQGEVYGVGGFGFGGWVWCVFVENYVDVVVQICLYVYGDFWIQFNVVVVDWVLEYYVLFGNFVYFVQVEYLEVVGIGEDWLLLLYEVVQFVVGVDYFGVGVQY